MLILSKKKNHQAKKNIFNNQKSFLSTSTNYPATSRLKTESPHQLLTQRTKTSHYQTNNNTSFIQDKEIVFSKTINFQTIKKKIIFNKNSIKRHMQDQKEKLYRSLDAHDNKRQNSKEIIKANIQKDIKLKAHIQTKSSNSVQGFFKSKIKAYGISTFKGQKNIMNNHFVSVHLGKVKQFLLIQNLQGFSTGSLVKKQLPIQVIKYYLENSNKLSQKNNNNYKQNSKNIQFKINNLQRSVERAFEQTNAKIIQNQKQIHDNSGCFVNGVFITENQVLAANCGTGSVFYFNKEEQIKQLGSIHNTFNLKELQRITKNRGKIYQTQFNLKFKSQMGIKGPIRVYPNGTTYTRILGKTFDKIVKKSSNPQDQDVYLDSPILSQPQFSHAKVDDVQWIVILSSGLAQFLGKTLICSIILYQISKYGLTFTIHDLAGQCSKSIINQAIIRGFQQTMSVQVIILNLNTGRLDLYEELQNKNQIKTKKQIEQKLKRQTQSLKYIGKRKNFVVDFKK